MAISKKFPEYVEIARLDPDTAIALWVLDHLEDLRSGMDTMEFIKELIHYNGIVEGMERFGELTRLSMIVGDQSKTVSAKNVRDRISQAANK